MPERFVSAAPLRWFDRHGRTTSAALRESASVIVKLGGIGAVGSAALVALSLVLTPALAATTQPAKKTRPAASLRRRHLHPRRRRSPPRRRARPPRSPGQQLPLHPGADLGQPQPVDPGRHPRPRRDPGRRASPRRRRVGDPGHRDHAHRLQSRRLDRLEAVRAFRRRRQRQGRHPPRRPQGRGGRSQLFGQPLHRPRRGRSRQGRSEPRRGSSPRTRATRSESAAPTGSPATSMSPAESATRSSATGSRRSRTRAATARPSTSAPPSASKLAPASPHPEFEVSADRGMRILVRRGVTTGVDSRPAIECGSRRALRASTPPKRDHRHPRLARDQAEANRPERAGAGMGAGGEGGREEDQRRA